MRCGIVGMKARSVEADLGITPTIAHVPTGIVHPLPSAEDGFEKVPAASPRSVTLTPAILNHARTDPRIAGTPCGGFGACAHPQARGRSTQRLAPGARKVRRHGVHAPGGCGR